MLGVWMFCDVWGVLPCSGVWVCRLWWSVGVVGVVGGGWGGGGGGGGVFGGGGGLPWWVRFRRKRCWLILRTREEIDVWRTAPAAKALTAQKSLPSWLTDDRRARQQGGW